MRSLAIRRDDPVPLYYQLAELIRGRIASGEFQPGDRLPSARTISDEVGISRMTVRQALDYLERQGHLVVRHGYGTFVAAPKLTFHAMNLLGFTQELIDQGRSPSSRVLDQRLETVPSATIAARLAIEPDSAVVRISRVRLSQDVPILLETVYLPSGLCPGLESVDLSRVSLYGLLEQRYRLTPQRTHQSLDAAVANDFESDLFGVVPGTPVILMEGVTSGPGDVPIEYFKAIIRGDHVRFEFVSQVIDGDPRVLARPVLTAESVR